eukprot:15475542-Alexandrium_andersonii.AAC.1
MPGAPASRRPRHASRQPRKGGRLTTEAGRAGRAWGGPPAPALPARKGRVANRREGETGCLLYTSPSPRD